METLLVLLMVGAGGVGAVALLVETARRERRAEAARLEARAGPETIAATILAEIARAGGASRAEAEVLVAEESDAKAFGRRIDLTNWAEAFARQAGEAERCALLESAVRLAVSMAASIPRRQYGALQDLSFGLGFHADALARLRAKWRFEYADYARGSRPVEADRAGIFRRVSRSEQGELMKTLGLSGRLERATLIAAYRRLAGAHHPDRVHDRGQAERDDAARRFIEITEAYEKLLRLAGERERR